MLSIGVAVDSYDITNFYIDIDIHLRFRDLDVVHGMVGIQATDREEVLL